MTTNCRISPKNVMETVGSSRFLLNDSPKGRGARVKNEYAAAEPHMQLQGMGCRQHFTPLRIIIGRSYSGLGGDSTNPICMVLLLEVFPRSKWYSEGSTGANVRENLADNPLFLFAILPHIAEPIHLFVTLIAASIHKNRLPWLKKCRRFSSRNHIAP